MAESGVTNERRIQPNEPVTIVAGTRVIVGVAGPEGMQWYRSEIENVAEDAIQIAASFERARGSKVEPGTLCGLLLAKRGDARYLLRTEVTRRHDGDLPQLWLSRAGDWRRIQGRAETRIAFTILGPRARLLRSLRLASSTNLRVVVLDLSASGLQLWSQDPLAVGDQVGLALELPGANRVLHLIAEIVRVEQHRGVRFAWRTGARFRGLIQRDRDVITRFVSMQANGLSRPRLWQR